MDKVTIYEGKYSIEFEQGKKFRALRYGETWRDLTGDGLILAMFHEILELREKLDEK